MPLQTATKEEQKGQQRTTEEKKKKNTQKHGRNIEKDKRK